MDCVGVTNRAPLSTSKGRLFDDVTTSRHRDRAYWIEGRWMTNEAVGGDRIQQYRDYLLLLARVQRARASRASWTLQM